MEEIECCRRGCATTEGVERFAPHIWLCSFHRAQILGRAREQEQRLDHRVPDDQAHQEAVLACGWVNPPEYKHTHGDRITEWNGGLPSLGKNQ